MKIAIIGYSGSGKSTLARELGAQYQIPVLHMDSVHWLPGWQERPREEEIALVESFLNENPGWVIDGNYSKLIYERRLEEADQIILMQLSRFQCFLRCYRRSRIYKGKTREDMGAGCTEKFDPEFMKWILWKGRRKKNRQDFRRIARQYQDKTIRLTKQREIDEFVKKVQVSS